MNRALSSFMYFGQKGISSSGENANLRASRFRGPSANYVEKAPKQKKSKVYQACLHPEWVKRAPANGTVYEDAMPTPDEVATGIFSLRIKNAHLYDDDKAEFADDEQDD